MKTVLLLTSIGSISAIWNGWNVPNGEGTHVVYFKHCTHAAFYQNADGFGYYYCDDADGRVNHGVAKEGAKGHQGGCTGMFITGKHILTAAHCFDHGSNHQHNDEMDGYLWKSHDTLNDDGDNSLLRIWKTGTDSKQRYMQQDEYEECKHQGANDKIFCNYDFANRGFYNRGNSNKNYHNKEGLYYEWRRMKYGRIKDWHIHPRYTHARFVGGLGTIWNKRFTSDVAIIEMYWDQQQKDFSNCCHKDYIDEEVELGRPVMPISIATMCDFKDIWEETTRQVINNNDRVEIFDSGYGYDPLEGRFKNTKNDGREVLQIANFKLSMKSDGWCFMEGVQAADLCFTEKYHNGSRDDYVYHDFAEGTGCFC